MKHRSKNKSKEPTPSTSRETRSSPITKRPIQPRGTTRGNECDWLKQRKQAKIDLTPFARDSAGRFAAIAERGAADDPMTLDELDSLQHEMESMLVHNLQAQRSLINLQETLSGNNARDFDAEALQLTGVDVQMVERSRSPSSSQLDSKSKQKKKKAASESSPEHAPVVPGPDKEVMNLAMRGYDTLGRARVFFCPVNHIPDKFWSYAEQYAVQLTPGDVAELDELAKEHAHDKMHKYLKGFASNAIKSPPNSPITSRRSSRRESALATAMEERRSSRRRTGDIDKKEDSEDSNSLGALTDRLVQALIDQQTTSKNNNHVDDVKPDVKMRSELVNGSISPNKALIKSLNIPNFASLENRIRSELKSHGLLQNGDVKPITNGNGNHAGGVESESESDEVDGSDADEVEQELRQRQKELHDVVTSNCRRIQNLIDKCKQAIAVEGAKADVAKANDDLIELFSTYYRQVPKRKPINKKERDQLLAALDTRKKALKTFDKIDKQTSLNNYLSLFSPLSSAPATSTT